MRLTISSLLLGLTLSSSLVSAILARRDLVTECTEATEFAECVAEVSTEELEIPLKVPVKVAVKGECYVEQGQSGPSGFVSGPADVLFRRASPRILASFFFVCLLLSCFCTVVAWTDTALVSDCLCGRLLTSVCRRILWRSSSSSWCVHDHVRDLAEG
jgi:hypothetical protein